MKYAFAAVGLATLAAAQDLSSIPSCAQPCVDSAVAQDGTCQATEYACICANIETLTGLATSCVLSSCGQDVAINQVLPAITTFCQQVQAGASSNASSAASSAPSVASSVSSTASSAYESATSTAATGSNSSTTATGTGPTPTSTFATAGAAHVAGPIGGVAAMILGALAFF